MARGQGKGPKATNEWFRHRLSQIRVQKRDYANGNTIQIFTRRKRYPFWHYKESTIEYARQIRRICRDFWGNCMGRKFQQLLLKWN